jgi:hypothetical protein
LILTQTDSDCHASEPRLVVGEPCRPRRRRLRVSQTLSVPRSLTHLVNLRGPQSYSVPHTHPASLSSPVSDPLSLVFGAGPAHRLTQHPTGYAALGRREKSGRGASPPRLVTRLREHNRPAQGGCAFYFFCTCSCFCFCRTELLPLCACCLYCCLSASAASECILRVLLIADRTGHGDAGGMPWEASCMHPPGRLPWAMDAACFEARPRRVRSSAC